MRSLRRKSRRRPGGQHGHPGAALAQVATPDRQERHEPAMDEYNDPSTSEPATLTVTG
jgi:hypothetical protein